MTSLTVLRATDQTPARPAPRPSAGPGAPFARAAAALFAAWRRARQRAATRRYLTEMDEHMLQDLGVSRAQASFELDRGGWHR